RVVQTGPVSDPPSVPPSGPAGTQAATLVAAAQAGSIRATARLLTAIEAGGARAAAVAATLAGLPRRATIVGLTGPPGVGKSTLGTALISRYRKQGLRVAVLAVDPSSPFSGGALLGDRVRMAEHSTDPGVFIRSMSTRGHLGGLSAAAPGAADLFSAIGFDVLVVETVGVGQNEVAVMRLADTVVLVLAPGMGDGIQAAKAGVLEIADVLVVNKSDREGASSTVRDLKGMVALGRSGTAGPEHWRVPVLSTIAAENAPGSAGPAGIDELLAAVTSHDQFLTTHGGAALRRQQRAEVAVEAVVLERIHGVLESAAGRAHLAAAAHVVAGGATDHHQGAVELLAWLAGEVAADG
ncbi:MAG TPA: methylmalonyl Co-A mutase-associated GTPase MeaB, partial [Nakamurella sp.]|nr:methylmalonyl Co-A mutase-associated GTPase MeaB [Nakamurella sp.]